MLVCLDQKGLTLVGAFLTLSAPYGKVINKFSSKTVVKY